MLISTILARVEVLNQQHLSDHSSRLVLAWLLGLSTFQHTIITTVALTAAGSTSRRCGDLSSPPTYAI